MRINVFILFAYANLNVPLKLRSASSIVQPIAFFGKIGRIASEEITLQLIRSKCIPALLYGLEA